MERRRLSRKFSLCEDDRNLVRFDSIEEDPLVKNRTETGILDSVIPPIQATSFGQELLESQSHLPNIAEQMIELPTILPPGLQNNNDSHIDFTNIHSNHGGAHRDHTWIQVRSPFYKRRANSVCLVSRHPPKVNIH